MQKQFACCWHLEERSYYRLPHFLSSHFLNWELMLYLTNLHCRVLYKHLCVHVKGVWITMWWKSKRTVIINISAKRKPPTHTSSCCWGTECFPSFLLVRNWCIRRASCALSSEFYWSWVMGKWHNTEERRIPTK